MLLLGWNANIRVRCRAERSGDGALDGENRAKEKRRRRFALPAHSIRSMFRTCNWRSAQKKSAQNNNICYHIIQRAARRPDPRNGALRTGARYPRQARKFSSSVANNVHRDLRRLLRCKLFGICLQPGIWSLGLPYFGVASQSRRCPFN